MKYLYGLLLLATGCATTQAALTPGEQLTISTFEIMWEVLFHLMR
jgi:hypothetical protein